MWPSAFLDPCRGGSILREKIFLVLDTMNEDLRPKISNNDLPQSKNGQCSNGPAKGKNLRCGERALGQTETGRCRERNREERERGEGGREVTSLLGALTLHKLFLNECTRNSINITIKQSGCEHPKQASWLIASSFFFFCSFVTIPFPKCLIPIADAPKLL